MNVVTLGYPLPPEPVTVNLPYSAATLLRGHVTSLRKEKGRLLGVQIDSQLNRGHAGGPVIDSSGKVIGMVAATVTGTAMNLAIPAYRLADFLAAPGIVFNPPPLTKRDRTQAVTWKVLLTPPKPHAKIPDGVSVTVTLAKGVVKPHTYPATVAGPSDEAGRRAFNVTLDPLANVLERGVELKVRFGVGSPVIQVHGSDQEITVGDQTLRLSDIRVFNGGPSPRIKTLSGQTLTGPVEGLGQISSRYGPRVITRELRDATEIQVETFDIAGQQISATVEVKLGSKVLTTIHKQAAFTTIER